VINLLRRCRDRFSWTAARENTTKTPQRSKPRTSRTQPRKISWVHE